MNKVFLMGRLTRDVEARASSTGVSVARYVLAVEKQKRDAGTDFINCVALGKAGEFAGKYLKKGTKVCVIGSWTTGSYDGKDGKKVYTNECLVSEHYFCESPSGTRTANSTHVNTAKVDSDGFMEIPDSLEDAGLPFN